MLSITDETGDFTLSFTNFVAGTVSSEQAVTYRVRANNLAAGAVLSAVTARLVSPFDTAVLEGTLSGYSNRGESEFSLLEEDRPGYIEVGTLPASLANKRPGARHGEHCLDGDLVITWRARLIADTPAGSESRALIVTLRDGN